MSAMAKTATIYHNPRCSTSRTVLGIIQESGIEPTVVRYLDTPPSRDGLRKLLDDAGLLPSQAIRKREPKFAELGLADADEDALLDAMVDVDAVVMYPAVQHTLSAFTIRYDDGEVSIDGPTPFLEAAADAMNIGKLRVIDTGLDNITAEREQWDDGNNTLAVEPGVVVAYERNVETNVRLEASGIEVLRISGSELGSGRGGPRCMSCPIARDPV